MKSKLVEAVNRLDFQQLNIYEKKRHKVDVHSGSKSEQASCSIV